MTYSLIGRCARTGRLGLGITTFSLAVGGRCEGVAANVGVCKTQAFPNRTNDPLGIKLLAQGYLPSRVMEIFDGKNATWRKPDDVLVLPELPHTATGKVHKMILRDTYKDYLVK